MIHKRRLKFAKTPEQWDRISACIERLQAGLNRSKQGVAEGSEQRVKIVAGPSMYIGKTGTLGKMSSHHAQQYPGHVLVNLDHGGGSTMLPKDAVKMQGVAEEQIEEASPEAIAKINQITRR